MNNLSKLVHIYFYTLRLVSILLYCKTLPKTKYKLELLGDKGANWWIPQNVITKNWVVYSGGVGEDISFDTAILKKYNCTVFAFDPTPRAVSYIEKQKIEKLNFYPIGLWKENKILKFFEPADKNNVSHSVVNLQKTASFFKAPCLTLKTLMHRLGTAKIDLLKLDIEGAEFAVLDQMFADKIFPRIIAVEFDQPKELNSMIEHIKKLLQLGYLLVKQDHFNFTFIRDTQ